MATKKAAKKSEPKARPIAKASVNDFDVIVKPIITEKSMLLIQEQNKVTISVKKSASKELIKDAFEKVFGVHVKEVRVLNVASKEKSRGGRYKGSVAGYKKAIVTVAEGEALDLFKE